MARILVFVCPYCGWPSGTRADAKTTTCRKCGKRLSVQKIRNSCRWFLARDEEEARRMIVALKKRG